jgi:hypothetical protein
VRDSDRFVDRSAVVTGKSVVRVLICTLAGHAIWRVVPFWDDVHSGLALLVSRSRLELVL